MSRLTIALDIMGGDHGPHIILPAALIALQKHPQLYLILCGPSIVIKPWQAKQSIDIQNRVLLSDCQQSVAMDETPAHALRHKKNSSMRRMLDLVKGQQAQACVSAGNTGALLAMATYVLKTLPGIARPALIATIPTINKGKVYLLDLGASLNSGPEVLFQYGVMGAVLAQQVDNIALPRVALLNVGTEKIKGNEQVRQAATLLAGSTSINYFGYIEGNDIFSQKVDVIVTDGFVGNIALKSWEGLNDFVKQELSLICQQKWWLKILAKLSLPLLTELVVRMKPDQYNGASLIGLRGIVVKSHGDASVEAFGYAIDQAVVEAKLRVPDKIKDKIEAVLMECH